MPGMISKWRAAAKAALKALSVTRLSDLDDDATSLPSVTAARRQADKLVGDGSRSSVIMAPLLWLAKKASALPLSVMTDDDAEVDRPEMLDLLTWPLRFEIAIDVPLYGNAYLEIIRGSHGPAGAPALLAGRVGRTAGSAGGSRRARRRQGHSPRARCRG